MVESDKQKSYKLKADFYSYEKLLLWLKAEIDARGDRIDSVKNFGQNLVTSGHSEIAEIKKALSKLQDAKVKLIQAWEERKTTLDQALELQVL